MNISRCLLLGLVAANIFALAMGYEGAFEAYDTDNNRKITRSEATAFIMKCDLAPTTAQLDAMFEAADKDSSGDVVIVEFPALQEHNYHHIYKECFDNVDTDDDSSLSYEELVGFFHTWSGLAQTTTDEEFQNLFDRTDTDGNNKIDYTELKNQFVMF